MKTKLDAMSLQVMNPFLQENEVYVNFEYEKLSEYEVKFFLFSYVGKNQYEYRFCLKMVYIVDFENWKIDDEDTMIQEGIQSMIPSLTDFIITIDTLVKKRRH